MPFPLVKLVSLGLRQASRHVAAFVKKRAKQNQTIRRILIVPAKWYHSIQTKSRLSILGIGKVKQVKPLSEEAALDLGTEILGDLVIIGWALGIYVFIESRSSKSKDEAEEEKFQELCLLKKTVSEQGLMLEQQSAQIREMERLLHGTTMYDKTSAKVMEQYRKSFHVESKS